MKTLLPPCSVSLASRACPGAGHRRSAQGACPAGGGTDQRPPGGTITVALEENIRAGWHTYWINPGDAGAGHEINWTLPPGWKAGAIQWPTPKRLPVGPLMDYGYEGKLWLLQMLTVPADAKLGDTITLKAAAHWLVCKDICVPEDADADLAAEDRRRRGRSRRGERFRRRARRCCRWLRPGN